MKSVKLTKALAPQIIAEVAAALANILLVLRAPTPAPRKFGIWPTRQSRIEHALRALAVQPKAVPESRKVLERGFREVKRQVECMRNEAEKNAAREGQTSSQQTQAERWGRSGRSAQMLLGEVEHVYQHLEEYLTAIGAGRDYYLERSEVPGIDTTTGHSVTGGPISNDGGMLYQA